MENDFFEGREKLLEIWFKVPSPSSHDGRTKHPEGQGGLRLIPRSDLEALLAIVKCTILDSMHNSYIDSYILSESSLFVSPCRIILKTCGQTTLLKAVPRIVELAQSVGLNEVEELFYSRHAFMEPLQQAFPHQSFQQEVLLRAKNCCLKGVLHLSRVCIHLIDPLPGCSSLLR
eukprot:TRINITY_DN1292_c0_g1_i2.p2 TRINITY_DN1292_c0_g1~~TRINITY_DN1292_c0_g1_i2.p2  ORF type:complete len:174 (+),score=22.23 TRINITY_DN1292_c0_g1_i2:75-596(+)